MRLPDEGRHQSDQQQHDEPRRIDDETGSKTQYGDHILRLAEHLAEQRHAAHGQAPCPVKPVLQFAVLEIFKIERCRVDHQPDAGIRIEPVRQQ